MFEYNTKYSQYKRTLKNQLSPGESYEYYIHVTNEGYSVNFNGEILEPTLFAKTGKFADKNLQNLIRWKKEERFTVTENLENMKT